MTRLAPVQLRERDLSLAAVGGFFKLDLQIVTQICTALRARGIAPLTAAEELLKDIFDATTTAAAAECFAEHLERIMESAAAPVARPATRVKGVVPVLVVSRALLRIAQRLVSFADLLELLLRRLVTGVFVRMILHGHLAISLLDLVFAGSLLSFQDLVVIAFGHGGGRNTA